MLQLRQRHTFCACLVCVISGALLIWVFWPLMVDDAFICFRFAENFHNGHGLSWNPGEGPVEGMTSILWTCLMGVLYQGKEATYMMAKLIGTFFIFTAVVWAAVIISRKDGHALFFGPLLLLTCAPLYFHAVNGLETGMAIFSVTWLLWESLHIHQECRSSRLLFSTMLRFSMAWLFSCASRPELLLYGGALLALNLYWADRKTQLRMFQWAILLFVVPGTVLFFSRFQYFGHFFPLTFYAKKGEGLFQASGVSYVLLTFILLGPLLSSVLIGLCFRWADRDTFQKSVLMTVPALVGILFYSIVQPIMGFVFRFTVPYFLPLIIANAFALVPHRWSENEPPGLGKIIRLQRISTIATVLMFLGTIIPAYHWATVNSTATVSAHVAIGQALKATNVKGILITLNDTGGPSYYSDWISYEGAGLCTPDISVKKLSVEELIEAKHPDVVLVSGGARRDRIYEKYVLVKSIPWIAFRGDQKKLSQDVFVREDSAIRPKVELEINRVYGFSGERPWYLTGYRSLKSAFKAY